MPINGFEDQTENLSQRELELVPLFVQGFEKKIGKESAVTSKSIIAKLRLKGIKITDARIRKIVNHIRTKGIIPNLVATSKGYYRTDDDAELARYEESLDQRENEIRRVKEGISAYRRSLKQSKAA